MHDVRPLECERTRAFLSVRLDDGLSHFERPPRRRPSRGCDACRAFERESATVTAAIRAAPLERLPVPCSCRRREGRVAARSSRATRRAAALGRVVAFLGFAAAPDRSAWQDDHALIAAALDQPAGTNDLLIDVIRPSAGSRAGEADRGRHRRSRTAVKPALPGNRRHRRMPSPSGEARLRSGGERPAEDEKERVARAAEIADAAPREHRDGRPRQDRGDPARPQRARMRRPRALRGRPGHREDRARPGDRAVDRGRRRRRGSSARPTCSRTTSPASRSTTRRSASSSSSRARSSRTSCSSTRSTARCRRRRPRSSRRWRSSR